MKKNWMIKYLPLIIFLTFPFFYMSHTLADGDGGKEDEKLYYLWSETCSVCAEATIFLDNLQETHDIEIVKYEVNQQSEQFNQMIEEHDINSRAVPLFIYKGAVWQGFNQIVERSLLQSVETGVAIGMFSGDVCDEETLANEDEECGEHEEGSSDLSFYGFNFKDNQLLLPTIIIGAVDGFNPCSLWALMFLTSMIIRFQSRRIMMTVGITFILTIAFVYGLFIAGLFSIVVNILEFFWLRVALFLFVFAFAFVNMKDFFTTKGFSFSISSDNKKKFIQKVREKIFSKNNTAGIISATIAVALFASLIELPCTAGFPIIWNSIVAEQNVGFSQYAMLLSLYLLMYVLIEISFVVFMTITLTRTHMNLKVGQTLKLTSGMLMLFLAVVLLMGPAYMNNMTLIVVGSIIVLAFSIVFAYFWKK